MRKRWILSLALGLAAPAAAQTLTLTLADSEQAAVAASNELQAAQFDAQAAQAQADSLETAIFPRLALDGRYSNLSHVPSQKIGPVTQLMGDYNNYSVGVSATWSLLSLGAAWPQWQAARSQAAAAQAQAVQAERQLRLRVRLAYFQTRLAATQQRLYADALNLAQSQAGDLDLRLKAGSSSRIDALEASNDELDRRSAYRLSQADLAGALRQLFALTGADKGVDLSAPVVDALGQSLPAHLAEPSLAVHLDDSSLLLAKMAPAEQAAFKAEEQPQWRALQSLVDQAQHQADAAWAGHLPSGSVGYRLSEDYPDSINLKTVTQQTLSANVSLPLYSFGQVSRQVDAQKAAQAAAQHRRDRSVTDMETSYLTARDRLAALKDQRDLQTLAAQQAAQLRELVYQSYKVGGSTFLEVQSSSLKSLQANLALAITETQMLISLADLAALTDSIR